MATVIYSWFAGRIASMQCIRCGLLLQMLHVAWSACVSVCLCVGHTAELCKNGWSDRDTVWGRTHVGPSNHVLDKDQGRTNPFASTRGDKSGMQPFAKLPWKLIKKFITYDCVVFFMCSYLQTWC